MNVIIANEQQQILSNLDIDIIKNITGSYDAREIVSMFKDFFFNKMILDVTAIKGYENADNYLVLAQQLDPGKIILFIPENNKQLCTSMFLSKIITFGIYNFTTNIDGIKYLMQKPNTYADVENLLHMVRPVVVSENSNMPPNTVSKVIGFRSITDCAGSTTLIYMLKKELESAMNATVLAIEVDKRDFVFFNEKNMISTTKEDLKDIISQNTEAQVILVDLNAYPHDEVCQKVFYLVEPSIIKLNKAIFGVIPSCDNMPSPLFIALAVILSLPVIICAAKSLPALYAMPTLGGALPLLIALILLSTESSTA
jgi:hypothetical protein